MAQSRVPRTSHKSRWIAAASAAGLLVALIPLGRAAQAATPAQVGAILCSSQPSAVADFNGDKSDDIAVGAPGDGLEKKEIDGSITTAKPNAGSINIVYGGDGLAGSKKGLQPANGPIGAPKFISQDSPGVVGGAHAGDGFGSAIAVGDFNHDGSPDLAVGAPGQDSQAGAVHIFYGGGTNNPGIRAGTAGTSTYNQMIKIGSRLRGTVVTGSKHPGDLFGWALSTGDYNLDGFTDLAIGVPGYDVSGRNDAGAVLVIYGGPDGLNPAKSSGRPAQGLITLPRKNVFGRAGDFFGASLATGNFNAQGADDLAVGAPGTDIGRVADAGGVAVVYGGTQGLALNQGPSKTVDGEGYGKFFRWFTENTNDVSDGPAAAGDRFGCSLAAGNFDGDASFDTDLAIGAPGRAASSTATAAGAVTILYNAGFGYGVSAQPPNDSALNCPGTPNSTINCWTDAQSWTENAGGIPGVAKKDDQFGASLYAADLNGDGAADLVIGVPNEKLWGQDGAGSVRVIFGFDKFGLVDRSGMAFAQRPNDQCTADDSENLGICEGNAPDYTEVGMIAEKGDHFGATLAVGDFNGDKSHSPDIVIGVPGESVGNTVNYLLEEVIGVPLASVDDSAGAGALQVIYDVTAVDAKGASTMSTDVLYRTQGGLRAAIDALAAVNGQSNGNGIVDDLADDGGGTGGAPGGGGGIGNPGLAATEPGGSLSSAPLTGDHLGGALG